ncbi:MAG: CBS and ACT domain-containing protein [Bacillota bacterium]|nr:CBS and ACT domain-containing protein [Bacillota bacterium]
MLVEEIMTRQVITLTPEDRVLYALQLAKANRIRHFPVVEGKKVVGVVSERDLRSAIPALGLQLDLRQLEQTPVRALMHTEVITVHPLDPIEEAARLMYQHKIGCLPVVSGGELVGIITETDVLRSLVELLGGLHSGSRLEVEVPDRPGVLAEIGEITKRHGINITSLFLAPSRRQPGHQVLVLRLDVMDLHSVARDIEAAGYQIVWPAPKPGESFS